MGHYLYTVKHISHNTLLVLAKQDLFGFLRYMPRPLCIE